MVRANYQFAFKLETQEGVDSAPTGADVITLSEDLSISPNVAQSDARAATGTHARQRSVSGRAEMAYSSTTYLVGSRDPQVMPTETPRPPFDNLLRGCGTVVDADLEYVYVTLKSHVGTFVRGETVTWDGGGTGTVVNFAIPGSGTLLVIDTTMDVDADDTLTGGTSGATAAADGAGVYRRAYRYRATSYTTVSVVATHASWAGASMAVGDILLKVASDGSAVTKGYDAAAARIVAIDAVGLTYTIECEPLTTNGFESGDDVSYYDISTDTLYDGGGTAPTVTSVTTGRGPSGSAWALAPGLIEKAQGCRGTFGLTGEAGAPVGINFEIRGNYNAPETGKQFPNPTIVSFENVPKLELSAVNLDGQPIIGQSFEFSLNRELATLSDYHGSQGVRAVRASGRDPQVTVDPVDVPPEVQSFADYVLNSTDVAFVMQVGRVAGNMFVFVISNGQVTQATPADRDGERTVNLTINARVASTEDYDVQLFAL